MARKTCPRPDKCTAAARGPCAVCHPSSYVASATATNGYWTPQRRAAQGARMKAQHDDPAFQARARAAGSRTLHRLHEDPDTAAAMAKRARQVMRRLRQDPAFLAKLNAAQRRPRRARPEITTLEETGA